MIQDSILSEYPLAVWFEDSLTEYVAKAILSLDWAFRKFDGDPYVQGAADYLDEAIGWARQTKLKVVIDLHGAPGSQNGFDNSGQNGTVGWGEGNTIPDTRAVLQLIANKYAKTEYQDVVVAIQLLNEPQPAKNYRGKEPVVQ